MTILKRLQFALLAVVVTGNPAIHAQQDPTFTTSNKITAFQIYQSNNDSYGEYSPAIVSSPVTGKLWAAYVDSTTNALSIAYANDGVNFNVTQRTGQFMNSAPTWAVFNNTLYLAFAKDNNTISIDVLNENSGTVTDQQDLNLVLGGGVVARRPGLAAITTTNNQNYLYLAWDGDDYDPGSGDTTGPWVNVIKSNLNLSTFPTVNSYVSPVSTSYMAGSAPALTTYNGEVFLTYLDANTGYPQLFATTSAGSTSFVDTTGPGGGHGHYAGDPAPVAFQGALYPMFRSAYQEDNLWTIGTYDGTTFSPPYMYGQTLLYSPSLTVSSSGTIYQAGFTNYPSSGTYMWVQSGSSATIDPYPQSGTGGGGGTGGTGCGGKAQLCLVQTAAR